ncbi:MAG TPA: metallophosphoesterase [Actinomycetota bacterium]|nr:metallophosphoesterase [Actinomycetota bacterium]
MIRVAAAGDLHFGPDSTGTLRPALAVLAARADALLLAGDLTKTGTPAEAEALAAELSAAPVPVVAVLGNHDHHSDRAGDVRATLEGVGVTVLDGEATVLELDGARVGVVGAKGFGGGFIGASASEFGEPEMKAFVRRTKEDAERIRRGLGELEGRVDLRVALLHYAPVRDTLQGEPPELFPFLGSSLLAEAVDGAGADLVLHGHAHRGTEKGATPGGVKVRNVAQPVLGRAYRVYRFS